MKLGLHSFDLSVHTALVTGSFVHVDHAFTCHHVDNRNCFFVSSARFLFISSFDSVVDLFDTGAHHRTHACISLTAFVCLSCAFL